MKLRVILIGLVLAAVLAGLAAYRMMKWAEAPVASETEHLPSKVVVIPEGSTFQHVAGLLERERLIKSRSAFVLLGKAHEADRKIRPGEYELNPAMAPADILTKLMAGRVVLHSVTIPEGYTMVQIADVLERWFRAGAADGFNVMPPFFPGQFDAFADSVVPILQERGLFRADYTGRTLRDYLGLARPLRQLR